MKKLITICAALIMTASVFAQAPEKMSYQAVIRNSSDALVTSTAVGMRISILQTTATGTAVYVETQTPNSNANGLVSLEIGAGTVVSGDFTTIDWANGPYFIKTETDPTGGTSYTITGTSQLLSVPYALHAKTADNVPSGTAAGQMQYWNGSAWVVVAPGSSGQVLTNENGVPEWKSEVGDNFVINFTTGKIWMDRNLGATQVATSSTDAASFGHLYQWGRGADGHQIRTSATTTTLSSTDQPGNGNFILAPSTPDDWRSPQNNSLWQGVNGVNNPCPSGYRLPTETELNAERLSWSANNIAGAFASPLKLPAAGGRNANNGSLFDVGTSGDYWSSTVNSNNTRIIAFNNTNALMADNPRAYGRSVRCIKD